MSPDPDLTCFLPLSRFLPDSPDLSWNFENMEKNSLPKFFFLSSECKTLRITLSYPRDANLWRSKIWRFFPAGLPTPPPSINLLTPPPLLSPPPPLKRTHPFPSSSFRIQEYSAAIVNLRENRVLMSRIFIIWLIGDPIKQSVIWLW